MSSDDNDNYDDNDNHDDVDDNDDDDNDGNDVFCFNFNRVPKFPKLQCFTNFRKTARKQKSMKISFLFMRH